MKPIYCSGKLLENLVNDMLDYSLIITNEFKLDISKFRLYDKILEIFEYFAIQAEAKKIK